MYRSLLLLFAILLVSCNSDDNGTTDTPGGLLQLQAIKVGTTALQSGADNIGLPIDQGIVANFNLPLNRNSVPSNFILKEEEGEPIALNFSYLDEDRTISAQPETALRNNTTYTIEIGAVEAVTGEIFSGTTYQFTTVPKALDLETIHINAIDLSSSVRIQNVATDFEITAVFSDPLPLSTALENQITLRATAGTVPLNFDLSDDQKTLSIQPAAAVEHLTRYTLNIASDFSTEGGYNFEGFVKSFYTAIDSTYKFPEVSQEALLSLVQEQTFKYFWDFAHPASGMARERNTSGDLVTTGGSGFGLMTIPVGIERGFITRQEGIDRVAKITNFLKTADRFHGVWPHWINGNTGATIPFSTKDNGGDLVETAFMIQGLLTVRQYLNEADPEEAAIIGTINELWEDVEWDWYTKGGENVLYWHWSPDYGWEMNHQIRGWNESLIVYVLAAASPTHGINAEVYHEGWAGNGSMTNGKDFYETPLPLGPDYGGPLFFAHYSFLGLDPRALEDQYANYWTQNRNHALIHQQYAIENPRHFVGYGASSWGLTASDNHEGYSAHSPTNDLGVITPTAALASMPYTPEQSLEAMNHFYYLLGDKLWGEYGFYDAFNPTEEWYADSYLAIDQGPIVIMIENYRSGLLWNLFMTNPEVVDGLEALGFTSY